MKRMTSCWEIGCSKRFRPISARARAMTSPAPRNICRAPLCARWKTSLPLRGTSFQCSPTSTHSGVSSSRCITRNTTCTGTSKLSSSSSGSASSNTSNCTPRSSTPNRFTARQKWTRTHRICLTPRTNQSSKLSSNLSYTWKSRKRS